MAGGKREVGFSKLSRSEHGGDRLLTVTVFCGSCSVNWVGELGKMVVGLSILLLPL